MYVLKENTRSHTTMKQGLSSIKWWNGWGIVILNKLNLRDCRTWFGRRLITIEEDWGYYKDSSHTELKGKLKVEEEDGSDTGDNNC